MKIVRCVDPVVCDADGCSSLAEFGVRRTEARVQFRFCRRCLNDLYGEIARIRGKENAIERER